MFRPATRLIAHSSALRAIPRATTPTKRFLSTAPPSQKSRSWKSLAARVGIAGAVIYYYNTTEVFAEEPGQVVKALPETDEDNDNLPTIEALALQRQQRKAELEAAAAKEAASAQPPQQGDAPAAGEGGMGGLEEEAGQQGAFNPETGEINWDCPCLGGMADGPCGEDFKAAFSCFVYSTEEPKGMDCIDKFKDMQNCFRKYPEVYGSELESDEEDDVTADDIPADAAPVTETTGALGDDTAKPAAQSPSTLDLAKDHALTRPSKADPNGLVPESYRPAEATSEQVKESDKIIPTAAFDGTAETASRK